MSGIAELLKLNDYCVITFNTTSQALKSEKILKEEERSFVIMPTPREISTSCGLALKMKPDDTAQSLAILRSGEIDVAGVYRLVKNGTAKEVTPLDM